MVNIIRDITQGTKMEKDNGYLNWYEFAPQDNLLIIKYTPDETKQTTDSGIIISTGKASVVTDRPQTGVIMSTGPDVEKFQIGNQVFFAPQVSFDLEFFRTDGEERYMMVPEDRIDGLRVKDVRQ